MEEAKFRPLSDIEEISVTIDEEDLLSGQFQNMNISSQPISELPLSLLNLPAEQTNTPQYE